MELKEDLLPVTETFGGIHEIITGFVAKQKSMRLKEISFVHPGIFSLTDVYQRSLASAIISEKKS